MKRHTWPSKKSQPFETPVYLHVSSDSFGDPCFLLPLSLTSLSIVNKEVNFATSNSIDCIYRVIHKSLRDFRTRLRNNQEGHGRKEHINR